MRILAFRKRLVFSINSEELQHTIKHYYGESYDACRYLDRFFSFRIALPPANYKCFLDSIGISGSYTFEIVCKRIIDLFHFELREIIHFYSQAKVAVYKPTHDKSRYDFSFTIGKGRQFILVYIVPLLIGLKMSDETGYQKFINGENLEILQKMFEPEEMNYYVFDHMLEQNEILDEPEEGKTLVTKEKIVNRIYNAIFVCKYEGRIYEKRIGEYSFNNDSKNFAISSASMMTEFADF